MQIPPVTEAAATFTIISVSYAACTIVPRIALKCTGSHHSDLLEGMKEMEELLNMIESWGEHFGTQDQEIIADKYRTFAFSLYF